MKLFSAYNKINLVATVLIFVLASAAYYFLLRYVLIDQLDENLNIEQEEIESYIEKYNRLPEIIPVQDQTIKFSRTNGYQNKRFITTVAYDTVEKDIADFRELHFSVRIEENKWYLASVGKSMERTENLIQSEESPLTFTVTGNVETKRSARTIAIDETSGTIYLPAANLEAQPGTGQGRPRPIPGSFQILVIK